MYKMLLYVSVCMCVCERILLTFLQPMLPNFSNDIVVINKVHMPFAYCCGVGDVEVCRAINTCYQCQSMVLQA